MKNLTICFILFTLFSVQAQFEPTAPWMLELEQTKEKSSSATNAKYTEVITAFNNYWKSHDANKKGSGYKPFMRWDEFHKHSLMPDGTLPPTKLLWDAWEQKKQMTGTNKNNATNWTPMGPFDHVNTKSWSPGQGRVNVAIIDPNNSNIMYVGTPAGGLWKSTNKGINWTPLTDHLPQLGVSGIAVDPKNSNIIYIATGDDDSRDSYGIGVMKSTDAGITWTNTGVKNVTGNDIYIDPENSNNLWVATDGGLYRTRNAGGSWTKTLSGNIKDVKIKPGNANIVYAVTATSYYKSTNGGSSFTKIASGLPSSSGRLVLEVTPANPEYVYILSANTRTNDYSFQGLYISTNSGSSFSKTKETNNIFESSQAWYDMAFTVSDIDPNIIFTGVLNIWKSTNRGDSFTKINSWSNPNQATYTHADVHFLRYYNGTLLCGSDGGIYRSTNNGGSFTNLTKGLQIGQFYRISVAQNSSSDKLTGGLQDNGGYALKGSTWNNYYGADGMDCAVSGNNSDTYYGFTQNGGNLYKTTDRGSNQNFITRGPETGNWVTPLVSDKSGALYAGFTSVFKLEGKSFVKQTSFNFGGKIDYLDIDPSNENNMYACVDKVLYRSINKGVNWSKGATFSQNISSIEVHSDNSNIVYVTTSGNSGGVWKSTNKGANFANITGNLPSEGKFIVRHEKGTESIYLGTYLGVYHKNGDEQWTSYASNLPAVAVRDLEINLQDNVIIAGTFGRGIWKAPLASVNNLDSQAPTAPKNLNAYGITNTSFNIKWDASTDNIGLKIYEIYFGNQYRAGAAPNSNAATLSGLTPNTTYQVKIRAKDTSDNLSGFSTIITVTTTGPDNQAPTVPTTLKAANIKATAFTLSWAKSTDNIGVAGYDIYQNNTKIKSVTGTTSTITGLQTATAYIYKVLAKDAAGNTSGLSSQLKVTTLDIEAPTVPTNLRASNILETVFDLRWDASTDNVELDTYEIYFNNEFKVSIGPGGTAVKINNLTPNTTYQVKVRAKDISGNYSAFSNTISVTTAGGDTQAPTAPKNLSATNIVDTSFDLRWEKSTDNKAVDKYEIYIDNQLIGSTGANSSAAKIPNLKPNTTYTAKIRAKDAAGNYSAFSSALTVKTLDLEAPTDPINLRSWDITATSFKIQWTVSTDNVALGNYEIFFDNVNRYSALPDANAVIIQNLTPNTTYTVKMRAKDTSGNLSGFSNTITVKTPNAPDTQSPTVPQDLVAFNETDKTFTINWKKSTDNVSLEGYEIYLGNTKKTTALPGATALLIDGLTPNTSYTVKLRAKDTAGNYSVFSNVITVKTKSNSNECINTIAQFPYNVGFENSLANWTQSDTNDVDWRMKSGNTPSNQTGPSSAYQGGSYIYVEASGSNIGYPNKTAILESPCLDLTNNENPKFSFAYHMYGSTNMGTIAVQAKLANTNNWSTIWEESGNKGNNWLLASIDLNSYQGEIIRLRFLRVTGATWKADIAIDNILLTASSDICEGVADWKADLRPYNAETKVVYNNNLFIRTSTGWKHLGACGTTSIEDRSNPRAPLIGQDVLKIYPNPVTTQLNILVPTDSNSRYTIIDMFGRIVADGQFTPVINVTSLESGSYILQISSLKKKYMKQFIKE